MDALRANARTARRSATETDGTGCCQGHASGNLAVRRRGSGLGVENLGGLAGKAGQGIVAGEGVVASERGYVGVAAMDGHGTGVGMDDPCEAYAVAEPQESLVVEFAAAVAGRCDLRDQVGNGFRTAGNPLDQRNLLRGEVGDVRFPHGVGVVFEPDAWVGGGEGTQLPGLDEGLELSDEIHDDYAMLHSGWRGLTNHAANKLAADALAVEPEQSVGGQQVGLKDCRSHLRFHCQYDAENPAESRLYTKSSLLETVGRLGRTAAEELGDGAEAAVGSVPHALEAAVEADEGEDDGDEVAGPGEDEAGEAAHEFNGAVAGGAAGEGGGEEEGEHAEGADEKEAEEADDGQEDDVEDGFDAAGDAIEFVVLDPSFATVFIGVEAAVGTGGGACAEVAAAIGAGGRAHRDVFPA